MARFVLRICPIYFLYMVGYCSTASCFARFIIVSTVCCSVLMPSSRDAVQCSFISGLLNAQECILPSYKSSWDAGGSNQVPGKSVTLTLISAVVSRNQVFRTLRCATLSE